MVHFSTKILETCSKVSNLGALHAHLQDHTPHKSYRNLYLLTHASDPHPNIGQNMVIGQPGSFSATFNLLILESGLTTKQRSSPQSLIFPSCESSTTLQKRIQESLEFSKLWLKNSPECPFLVTLQSHYQKTLILMLFILRCVIWVNHSAKAPDSSHSAYRTHDNYTIDDIILKF